MERKWNKIVKNGFVILLGLLGLTFAVTAHASEEEAFTLDASSVDKSNLLNFQNIPQEYLNDKKYKVYLRLHFQNKSAFGLNNLQITLNGEQPFLPAGHIGLKRLSKWLNSKNNNPELVIELTEAGFSGSLHIHDYIKVIQKKKGAVVKFKVGCGSQVIKGRLYFVRIKEKVKKLPPTVSLDRVVPQGANITSQQIVFYFHSNNAKAKFKCSLDKQKLKPCGSPMIFSNLTIGSHKFTVQPRLNGLKGKPLSYTFNAVVINPEPTPVPTPVPAQASVSIESVTPNASLTNSTSLDVRFSLSDGSTQGYCRVDGGSVYNCSSPVVLTELTDGAHKISIDSKYADIASEYAREYVWVVDRTSPTVQLSSSPGSLESKNTAEFSFEASEEANYFCALDGAAFQDCITPVSYQNLSEGAHQFQVQAQDHAGNISSINTFSWTVDMVSPELVLLGSNPQQTVSNIDSQSVSFATGEQAVFFCKLDNGDFSSCVSPYQISGLSEGAHMISIKAVDLAGNESALLDYSWQIDLTPPHITVSMTSPSSTLSAETSASFDIIADDISAIHCELDGNVIGVCHSPLHLSNLSEGTHILTVNSTDLAGNASESISYHWQIDITKPVLSIASIYPQESLTMENHFEVAFNVSEESTTQCEVDNLGKNPCTTPFILNNLLAGNHNVSITATDRANNSSVPYQYSWNIFTPSVASIDSISPSATLTSSKNIAFQFSSNTPANFVCSLDNSAFTACTSPQAYSNLADGSHHFEVRSTNQNGQIGGGDSHDWNIDATAPTVQFTSIVPATSPTAYLGMNIGFSANENAVFYCSLDGAAWEGCTSPYSRSNLGDGYHQFYVYAVDMASNMSSLINDNWTVDSTAPSLTLGVASPSHSPTASNSLSLSFTSNESATFYCSLDNAEAVGCASPYMISGLADGAHSLTVTARDMAGNLSSAKTYTWTIDSTPLVVANVNVTQITKTSAVISWTSNISSTSQVLYGEGITNLSTQVDGNYVTSHTITLTGLKTFTLYQFKVKSVDRDGRESVSGTLTFRTLR